MATKRMMNIGRDDDGHGNLMTIMRIVMLSGTWISHDLLSSHIGNYGLTTTTLGKGSFSKVVLADHVILKQQVALKVVTISKIKDPYVWKTMKREAAIMTKLNHPNIVTLHEVKILGS